ncbi:MAG: HAMP domain-containing protein [Desulfovibrionaceae bacterium]|nr:HAMP domain-containing protein [Desulfovibrionaceae bacterium]MBF0512597.1 HAMP domain-containing protein [Desulfovibrionaceae bacterium]
MFFLHRSLRAKVLVLVSLLTMVAFTGLFLANSYWQRESTVAQIKSASERTSDLLQLAIEEPMSLGKNTETAAQFAKVAGHYPDIQVYLVNARTNITYSTLPGTIRKDLCKVVPDLENPICQAKVIDFEHSSGSIESIGGVRYFVQAKTIKNEPACYHCHGQSKPYLGAMIVLKDVTADFNQLRGDQIKGAAISLFGLAALLTCLVFFMNRSLVNRIKTIAQVANQVSKGDLNLRFAVAGQDELARLANDLGNMVGTIKDQLEYNKSVLAGIIIPLFVVDREEKIGFINPPLQEILSKTGKDLTGLDISTAFQVTRLTTDVVTTGQSKTDMLHFNRSDGVVFPLRYDISPLCNASGEIVGAIGVMLDLTREERDKEHIQAHRESLLQVAQEVTDVATLLDKAAEDLAGQMVEVTQGVDKTVDQTTQVATAMEEMNATVLEVAKTAANTASLSEKANQVAKSGGEEVQKTVTETRQVADRTNTLAVSLNELSAKAVNIGQVMSVISDIADQTNLLALNAAIEAARAGEAGRGFAVVADEVRKLAEKTMHATAEVHQAINEIQKSTETAVNEMNSTRSRVINTADMAEQSGNVLLHIVEQSNTMADMVRNIATAAEEQSSTSEEINRSVSLINELSQDIAQRIARANDKIQQLRDMAHNLSSLVDQFKDEETRAIE